MGAEQYDNIERLRYKAIKSFLGVGKTTQIPAIVAGIGWHLVLFTTSLIRLWCRLINMPGHRISRKVFVLNCDMSRGYRNTLFISIKTLLDKCNIAFLNRTQLRL